MKTKFCSYFPILLGLFFFTLLASSCKEDNETIEVELSALEAPPLQEKVISAPLSFRNGESDIKVLDSKHLIAFYVQIVGLNANTKWNEPEIIEYSDGTSSNTSYYVKTTSTSGLTSVMTSLDKVGSDYLLVNRLDESVFTCICISTESDPGCKPIQANPCQCSQQASTCTKKSSATEASGLLSFLRKSNKIYQ